MHRAHASARTYDQWRDVLRGVRLPAVVVDLAAFDRNVARFADVLRQAGHRHTLRVATKSIRVPALIRRVLDFGAPYQGLMCYAAEEAAFLASQCFDDLLVAYPTVQPSDLAALSQLHAAGKRIRLIADIRVQLERLSAALAQRDHNLGATASLPSSASGRPAMLDEPAVAHTSVQASTRPFEVVLDVDMSWRPAGGRLHLGVRRSPLRSVDDVVELCRVARDLPNLRIVGLMGYEAQVAGLGDRNPFKRLTNPIAGVIRRRSVQAVARLREQLAASLVREGITLELFNGGGTGSADYTAAEPWLTEVTVGSGFLCSHLFDYYSNVAPEPACFFALQMTRSSDVGYVTCQGGGYIASGEPGWDKVPRPWLPAGLKLVSTEGCGEVQTPLAVPPGVSLVPGDPVLFRHAKAGELAEHFNEYLLVDPSGSVTPTPTYRGLGKAFL
ncbi:MAG: alanine racemase [Pirellulales bacterium]|nr:alanine racemase [Pirellulales bacterium]